MAVALDVLHWRSEARLDHGAHFVPTLLDRPSFRSHVGAAKATCKSSSWCNPAASRTSASLAPVHSAIDTAPCSMDIAAAVGGAERLREIMSDLLDRSTAG